MTLFDSAFATHFHRIACSYMNKTGKIQVIKITNIPHLYWERVVFPMQRLIFEAVPEAKLEIYSSECITALFADVIPCQNLRMLDAEKLARSHAVASLV